MFLRRMSGIIVGSMIGMAAGMMLAPQKGKKTRKRIMGALNRTGM
jgi:gas vesicle protein